MGNVGIRVFSWLAGLGLLVGCGTTQVVHDARTSLGKATDAGAEQAAPYPYYAAEAYLKLAETEAAEFDHRAAREFSETSMKFSNQALEQAGGGDR